MFATVRTSSFFFFPFVAKKINIKTYRAISLPVVLCVCESWSVILRVFENRVLRKKFGPKGDEVTREWRKLHKRIFIIRTSHQILFD